MTKHGLFYANKGIKPQKTNIDFQYFMIFTFLYFL